MGIGFNNAGEKVQITLTDTAANPIVGSLSDIKVLDHGTAVVVTGVSVTSIVFAGDGTNPAIVTLQVDFGSGPSGNIDIEYPTTGISLDGLFAISPIGIGTWELTGTPPLGSAGDHVITVRATANDLIDEETFTLTVSPP